MLTETGCDGGRGVSDSATPACVEAGGCNFGVGKTRDAATGRAVVCG
jgi:hypothetical protein